MNIFSFSRPSRLILHYGLFAIICQAAAILLCSRCLENASGAVHFHRYFPMIEHSLMSLVIIFIGVFAIEYINRVLK